MERIKYLMFALLICIKTTLSAQEHGIIGGVSLGTLHEKTHGGLTSNLKGYKFHYHIGYAYRQYLGSKFAIDGIALFGSQGTDYQYYLADSPKYSLEGKYVSLGTVVSYECFRNFRAGVGADVAWYVDRLGKSSYNKKKNAIDVPLVARVSYALKWFEMQLSYKFGTCNLIDNKALGKTTSRDIEFSLFVPLFKSSKR